MAGIERQSDYYGFIPEVAERAHREAALDDLPSEDALSALLSGPTIQAGMLDTRKGRDTGFDRRPAPTGRAKVAMGFQPRVSLLDRDGDTLALEPDLDAPMSFTFGGVLEAKNFIREHLYPDPGTGWKYDDVTGDMQPRLIVDFTYSDGQQDRTQEMSDSLIFSTTTSRPTPTGRAKIAALPSDPEAATTQITEDLGWATGDQRATDFNDWLGERFYDEGEEPTSADMPEILEKARHLGWMPEEEKWLPTPGAQKLFDYFDGLGQAWILVDRARDRPDSDQVYGDPMRAAIVLDRAGIDSRAINRMTS